MHEFAVADAVRNAEGNSSGARSRDAVPTACATAPPGSESTARKQWVVQELGRSGGRSLRSGDSREASEEHSERRSSEVGVSHTSEEAGEPTQGTLWSKGDTRQRNSWRER